jgi:hypothetical protein
MSSFKEKAQVFIVGLAIGLLIAGAFFILKLDDYFKELNLYKRVSTTLSTPKTKSENDDKAEESKRSSKKKEEKKSLTIEVPVDTVSEQPSRVEAEPDTLTNKSDSLYAALASDEEIVVRKDELITTRTLEVFNLSPVAKMNGKDSLLQKVSGIKEDKSGGKQMINIELWSSPLNYKGYKMSKYKLVLYGLSTMDGIKLYKLDDVIYLKNASIVYRLDPVSDFKAYERITDEQVLNKLK